MQIYSEGKIVHNLVLFHFNIGKVMQMNPNEWM